jgi:GAF domain-containing protein
MRRHSRAGSKSVKERHRKAAVKSGPLHQKVRARVAPVPDQETEVAKLTHERDEALEQQRATAEVLKIISASWTELQPVLDVVVRSAARYCEADDVTIFEPDGQNLRVAAHWGALPRLEASFRIPCTRGTVAGRTVLDRKPVHVTDLQAEAEDFPEGSALARQLGHRTIAGVPLLREGVAVGTLQLRRAEVNPFSSKQITLLETFAAQAVIAIENARLLSELRQRTTDLAESLEQQTATSEVLEVISSSPGALEPVFQAILANATRLCGAKFGGLSLYDDGVFRNVALYNVPPEFADMRLRERSWRPHPRSDLAEVVRIKQPVQVNDTRTSPPYLEGDSIVRAIVDLGGARTIIHIPMLKDEKLIGVVGIYRQEVRPFTDKQIELVKNFAAQAVIAIENARLLNELRQRTDDLTESLEQQTATSEVLGVISSSPGRLEPVFQSMLDNAVRICEAKFGFMNRYESNAWRIIAVHGAVPAYTEFLQQHGYKRPGPETVVSRIATTNQLVHIADMPASRGYAERDPIVVAAVEIGGVRTMLGVPMLKEGELIGAILLYRQEVRPFTDKQIALVQNFAAQAVIAIENARLLNELRQSLEQQTATADVLCVISHSPTNVQPVFDSIAESAVRLCGGQFSFVLRFDGKLMHFASCFGLSAEGLDTYLRMLPCPPSEGMAAGRAILRRASVEIPDVEADPSYGVQTQDLARTVAYRSIVAVPLLHEGNPIGAFAVARANAGSFPERQIALLQAFADQAVIAIRNVRLFDEVQTRTEELSESLQQQTATADVLKVISRSTFDLQTVLQTLVESAARLCEADRATITRQRNGVFYRAESYGFSNEFMEYVKDLPVVPQRGDASGRALLEGRFIHIHDVLADADYRFADAQRLGHFRTVLAVPMLREDTPIGVLALTRSEVRPFTDKQIELVQTFADQAAIAIENVRLFDEIQDKSRQLEEASQHKSQFLANMSHELRTPLNAILGYTELMADGAYGEPSEKMLGILKRLEANGRHLLGLINDVLDLSKIEAGQLMLELSDYCIQDIAQTVRSTLEPLAADKKLGFKVEVAPQLPSGHGDGRRLTQVLINLVGNAIKFTDAGEVAIKAEANNGSFHVSVRDTGPGISSADQARLFQEFQQADNAITRKKGGTGLGLAISKRIIEMHGGRIWVESQPGQGSTFTFTLPVIVERQVEAA